MQLPECSVVFSTLHSRIIRGLCAGMGRRKAVSCHRAGCSRHRVALRYGRSNVSSLRIPETLAVELRLAHLLIDHITPDDACRAWQPDTGMVTSATSRSDAAATCTSLAPTARTRGDAWLQGQTADLRRTTSASTTLSALYCLLRGRETAPTRGRGPS